MKINIGKVKDYFSEFIYILVILGIFCFLLFILQTKPSTSKELKQNTIEYFYQDIESVNLHSSLSRDRYITIQEIAKDLSDTDYVIYEVKDIIINNPQGEPNYTITTIINDEVRFLYVGAKNGYPCMELAYLRLKDHKGLNYIESEENYAQYIKIYKNKEELYSYNYQKYLEFPCELYIKNLTAGENQNGKFEPQKAENLGGGVLFNE